MSLVGFAKWHYGPGRSSILQHPYLVTLGDKLLSRARDGGRDKVSNFSHPCPRCSSSNAMPQTAQTEMEHLDWKHLVLKQLHHDTSANIPSTGDVHQTTRRSPGRTKSFFSLQQKHLTLDNHHHCCCIRGRDVKS